MAASGRKRPVSFVESRSFERPLLVKAAGQIVAFRKALSSGRYALNSGHSCDNVLRGR